MLFAHDTEVALAGVAALVNTAHGSDELTTVAALDAFVRTWEWTGSRTRDRHELEQVRALRSRLEALWSSDKDGAAAIVNDLLRESHAVPQLVKHDEWDYHIHAAPPGASLAVRMAVEGALAVSDVIRLDELDRLQVCAADDCADLLVDLSKNQSRRFCSNTCSNRTHVAAYRARIAGR